MARLAIFLCIAVVWAWGVSAAAPETQRISQPEPAPHVLVVGTGMAGSSAALEAARSGAQVTVIEMWSVYGGTSFISGGKVAIVGTALQQRRGINDSPCPGPAILDNPIRWWDRQAGPPKWGTQNSLD